MQKKQIFTKNIQLVKSLSLSLQCKEIVNGSMSFLDIPLTP